MFCNRSYGKRIKKTLLEWLSNEENAQEVADNILQMSKNMKKKGDYRRN